MVSEQQQGRRIDALKERRHRISLPASLDEVDGIPDVRLPRDSLRRSLSNSQNPQLQPSRDNNKASSASSRERRSDCGVCRTGATRRLSEEAI